MITTDQDDAWQTAVGLIVSSAARRLLAGVSFADFRDGLVAQGGLLFDALEIPAAARSEELRQAFATQLAYEIWNATPVPENRFRPRRIARPERNAPCPCASGRKYKQCCGAVEAPALGIDEPLMLAEVLSQWPRKRLTELPIRELHPDALATAAGKWLDDGRARDAAALLETYFLDLQQFDGRAEFAADTLLDCYAEIDAPRKKQRFIDALKAAPDKALRATGWQRQATIDSDRGKVAAAWAAFREAQRLVPNAPALSHLEVLLLLAEGRRTEARARADFWSARLARDPDEDHSGLIAALQDLTSPDDAGRLRALARGGAPLGRLSALIDGWPAPACHYALKHGEVLTPDRALARDEADWDAVSPLNPDGDATVDWLDRLAALPLAGHSFAMLRDLYFVACEMPEPLPGAGRAVARRLLERAEALRETVLNRLKAGERELPWGYLDNRPLLSLVAAYTGEMAEERPEQVLDLLRWSVLVANPNDNVGLRENLIHSLVAHGRADEAVAVAARYPDDFAFTEYGRVLALFAAGRLADAEQALQRAVEESPKIWKTLTAASPRKPRLDGIGYRVGGDDEAWLYRENHLAQWQASGALAWAVALKKPRGRAARPAAE